MNETRPKLASGGGILSPFQMGYSVRVELLLVYITILVLSKPHSQERTNNTTGLCPKITLPVHQTVPSFLGHCGGTT